MRKRLLLLALGVGLLGVILYAQEPARYNRGIELTQGNIRVARGQIIPTTGNFLHVEQAGLTGASYDSNQTYSALSVRFGWIVRDTLTANRTDALPTAANMIAEFPGAHAGTTHLFIVQNADSSETLTINGASTGVTYTSSCDTALAATEARMIVLVFRTVTSGSEAMTAICLET